MNVEVTQSDHVTVVVVDGDLDMTSAPHMVRTLTELLDQGKVRLVVDLAGVPYIDSTGLAELIGAMKRARQAGGDLRLCALQGEVLQVIQMTRLSQAMAVYPRRRDAVASWG